MTLRRTRKAPRRRKVKCNERTENLLDGGWCFRLVLELNKLENGMDMYRESSGTNEITYNASTKDDNGPVKDTDS